MGGIIGRKEREAVPDEVEDLVEDLLSRNEATTMGPPAFKSRQDRVLRVLHAYSIRSGRG
jgi:hypothetical protein